MFKPDPPHVELAFNPKTIKISEGNLQNCSTGRLPFCPGCAPPNEVGKGKALPWAQGGSCTKAYAAMDNRKETNVQEWTGSSCVTCSAMKARAKPVGLGPVGWNHPFSVQGESKPPYPSCRDWALGMVLWCPERTVPTCLRPDMVGFHR